MHLIRKISIGKDYKNEAMHYDKYSIHIKKGKESLPWKEFNKNMAIAVEFNLEY